MPIWTATGSTDVSRWRQAAGFTLIELTVVLLLLTVMAGLVIPRLPQLDAGGLERGARRIATTTRALYNEAALSGREHRLIFDLDQQQLQPRQLGSDGSLLAVGGLAAEGRLPRGVRLLDVQVAGQPRNTHGATSMPVLAVGWLPETVVHLADRHGEQLTVRLLPFSGGAEIHAGYCEF